MLWSGFWSTCSSQHQTEVCCTYPGSQCTPLLDLLQQIWPDAGWEYVRGRSTCFRALLQSECLALEWTTETRVQGHPGALDGAQTDAMVLFMWQDDMIGVVRFIDECLERILYTSDQP